MGVVYRAFDQRLDVARAIKVLSPEAYRHASVRARFEAEARTMAKLVHPNIVNVHDVGTDGDRVYMVMELAEGGTLSDRLDRAGPMAPRAACEATLELLAALQFAHERGVVHRDVKPHNVLVDSHGVCKLADFGIAHVSAGAPHATRTGVVMGTLAYMAPEQRASARRVDGRADLYAVAATLYVLLTCGEPGELLATEHHEQLFAGLPEPLVAVIKRGCRYRPEDRYATAAEMATALRAARDALPEAAPVRPAPVGPNVAPAPDGPDRATYQPDLDHDTGPGIHSATTAPLTPTLAPAGAATVASPPRPAPTTAWVEPPPPPAPARRPLLLLVGLSVALAAVGSVAAAGWWATREAEPAGAPVAEAPAVPSTDAAAAVLAAPEPVATTAPPPDAATAPSPLPATATPPPATGAPTEPDRGASRSATRSTATTASPPEPPAATRSAAPATSAVRKVFINAQPWAEVTIDGKGVGPTGWSGELSVGSHEVTLVTGDGRRKALTLTVAEAVAAVRYCWDFNREATCSF